MSHSCKRWLIVLAALGLCFVLGARVALARGGHGGGHGGGHHGGGHHGGEHHSAHHSHHHEHHGEHHYAQHNHNHHHGWYGNGWGWAGLGWGLGGYGLGGWGAPSGGWGNYAANQPMSLPVDNTYANINPAGAGAAPGANTLAGNSATGDEMENEEEEEPQENQFAANGNEPVGEEESEEPDIEARGAIHLALPNKDAKVFLDGQLVHGSGDRRLLLTPELEDKDKPHSFHLRTTWEENGRPAEREADVQVAAANGIAINFRRPIDTGAPATPLVVAEGPPARTASSGVSEVPEPAASQDVFSGRRDAAEFGRPAAH